MSLFIFALFSPFMHAMAYRVGRPLLYGRREIIIFPAQYFLADIYILIFQIGLVGVLVHNFPPQLGVIDGRPYQLFITAMLSIGHCGWWYKGIRLLSNAGVIDKKKRALFLGVGSSAVALYVNSLVVPALFVSADYADPGAKTLLILGAWFVAGIAVIVLVNLTNPQPRAAEGRVRSPAANRRQKIPLRRHDTARETSPGR